MTQCCSCMWWYKKCDSLIVYEEPKVVKIHSFTLCFFRYFGYLAVGCFILGFMVIYSHGFQREDPVVSSVTTKLHGVTLNNGEVWDNADYMVPPKENGAFTVITSILETPNQTRGVCGENPRIEGGRCAVDSDCQRGEPVPHGNGVMTGKCIGTVCQIQAWCPVENDDPDHRRPMASENFTVVIRNHVKFPESGETRQNFPDNMSEEELRDCRYDDSHPHCPVFTVKTIVEKSTPYSFQDLAKGGAVIQLTIVWDCTFDWTAFGKRDECLPSYRFLRLDETKMFESRGFHLRFADRFWINGRETRNLYRAYGIRVLVTVQGVGRTFSPSKLFWTVASSISYFAMVSFIISQVVLKWVHRPFAGLWRRRCCFKSLKDEHRTDRDREYDDLVRTTFVCGDALKKCGCCVSVFCGEREDPGPPTPSTASQADPEETRPLADPEETRPQADPGQARPQAGPGQARPQAGPGQARPQADPQDITAISMNEMV